MAQQLSVREELELYQAQLKAKRTLKAAGYVAPAPAEWTPTGLGGKWKKAPVDNMDAHDIAGLSGPKAWLKAWGR